MRHLKNFNHLSRKKAHRNAMLANMASSLVKHKRINTTVAKAKALRIYVEPLITKSKTDTTHSRRIVFKYLKDKYAVSELFRDVAPKIAERPGGYTRILKTGNRLGDNAEMCFIELVDFNENMLKEPKTKKSKIRTRRAGRKKITQPPADDISRTKETSRTTGREKQKASSPKTDLPPPKENKKKSPKAGNKTDLETKEK
ncbi:MAG: 50S ribosomal protein L17 [Bacteroidota bacterium]